MKNLTDTIKSLTRPHIYVNSKPPVKKALSTVQKIQGKVESYTIKNTGIPELVLNQNATRELYSDTNEEVTTTAREMLFAHLQQRLSRGLIPPCSNSKRAQGKEDPALAAIDLNTLLGEKGVDLYRKALAEEVKSKEFRRVVLEESRLYETGVVCKKRQMIPVAGPSGSGKSSGSKQAFKKALELHGVKTRKNRRGTHAIVVDGGLPREVSLVWKTLMQVSIDLNYSGIDLYSDGKDILEPVKKRLLETTYATPQASMILPETFSTGLTIAEVDRMYKAGQLFVANVDGDPAFFADVIGKLGPDRAYKLDCSDGKLPEGKPYNPDGFAWGKTGSKLMVNYVRFRYPETPIYTIWNNLILVTKHPDSSNWKVLKGKPEAGFEVQVVSKKLFEEYIKAAYLRGPPKPKPQGEEKKPDDLLAVKYNHESKLWELQPEDNSKDYTNQRFVRVRRDFWENLWPTSPDELAACDFDAEKAKNYRKLPASAVTLQAYNKFYTGLPEIHHHLWFKVKAAAQDLNKMLQQYSDDLCNGGRKALFDMQRLKRLTASLFNEIDALEKATLAKGNDLSEISNIRLKKISADLLKIEKLPHDYQKAVNAIDSAVKGTDEIMRQQEITSIERDLNISIKALTAVKKKSGSPVQQKPGSFWEEHKGFRDVMIGLGIFVGVVVLTLIATAIAAAIIAAHMAVPVLPVFVSLLVSIVTFGGFLPSIPVGIGLILTAGSTLFASVAALVGDWKRKDVAKEETIMFEKSISEVTSKKIDELCEDCADVIDKLDVDYYQNMMERLITPRINIPGDDTTDSSLSNSGTPTKVSTTSGSESDEEALQNPRYAPKKASDKTVQILLSENGMFSSPSHKINVDESDEEEDNDNIDYNCESVGWVLVPR